VVVTTDVRVSTCPLHVGVQILVLKVTPFFLNESTVQVVSAKSGSNLNLIVTKFLADTVAVGYTYASNIILAGVTVLG
jgi:hypothetical protein